MKLYRYSVNGLQKYTFIFFFSFECTDIEECASVVTNECDPNAWCTNTEGSYSCRCIRGFKGDGKNCTGEK